MQSFRSDKCLRSQCISLIAHISVRIHGLPAGKTCGWQVPVPENPAGTGKHFWKSDGSPLPVFATHAMPYISQAISAIPQLSHPLSSSLVVNTRTPVLLPPQPVVAKLPSAYSLYSYEETAKICTRFIRCVFSCPLDSNQPGKLIAQSVCRSTP